MSDSQQQKPSRKIPLPLYVQIAIALVVGTIAGVAINPGSIDLPDEQINVQLSTQVTPDEDEDGNPLKQSWLVRAADEDGRWFCRGYSASPIAELDIMGLRAQLPADRKFVDYKGRT